MNCADCQDLLQLHLDGVDITDQSALDLHLGCCSSCRVLHVAAVRLHQGLRLQVPPVPPRGLAGKLAARLLQEHAGRQRRRRVLFLAAAAAVLALLLSVRLLWFPTEGTRHTQERPVVQEGPERKPVESRHVEKGPTVRDSMSEVGSMMVSAATRTADATLAQSRNLLPLVPSASLPSLPIPKLDPATGPLGEAGQGVSEGLSPVTDSAKRAFDMFLRDLPPMNLDEKPGL
jgi:hypothetical protein